MDWQISSSQKKLLDELFKNIETNEVSNVLDVGSGRTSIQFLTERFPHTTVKGIVYPGDQRKIEPIKECVKNTNYELIEMDINNIDTSQEFDVVLTHLFLGEATKFAENNFEEILNKLFEIRTKYLVMVNLFRDNINYNQLLKKIAETGNIIKVAYAQSESGDECIGLTIQFK